jgi:CheY-like chemotaxis protein
MQVLVADDEITSRVMIETALRERGHTVRNSDDGLEAARLLAAPYAPRIAILSNTLARLRGLDVCRFLSASGRKNGVYVILVADLLDMELVELCRRAGVDDIMPRKITTAGLHSHLDVADRVVALETELRRMQSALQGLATYESPLDKKAKAQREANAALLGAAKRKPEAAPSPAVEKKAPAPTPLSRDADGPGKMLRGINIFSDKEVRQELAPEPAQPVIRSLLDEPAYPAKAAPQGDVDAILTAAATQSSHEIAQPAKAAQGTAPTTNGAHDEAQSAALASAEQVQSEELADEEIIHPFEFDEIILKVFSGMGVTLKTEIPPKALASGPLFVSWVGVAIIGEPVWLDMVMVAGEVAAKAVTKELLGQAKASDSDVCEMFSELQNMAQGSLRRYFEENGHKSVIQLTIPRAMKRDEAPVMGELVPVVESGFSIGGGAINVALYEHRESATVSDPKALVRYDLLCEPVVKDGTKDKLLFSGVIFKDKEQAVVDGIADKVKPFKVMHVSPLVQALDPEKMLG